MQKFYQEAARRIPVIAETDIVVAGGGPAGVGAAIAAARNGAKVILLEKYNNLGGMATSGMMSHWSGAEQCSLLNEVTAAMRRVESCSREDNAQNDAFTRRRGLYHEAQKTALQRLALEAGVTIQFHTLVVGAIMEGDCVRGVITESKSGREAIYAKIVIDATGDGDVAAFAGAEYLFGREEDHKCQPVTLMFRIGGVDYSRAVFPCSFESYIDIPKGEIQALGKANLPHPAGHVLLYRAMIPGEVCVNMTNVTDVDGTKAEELTRAELICRGQIEVIVPFLREYVPGFENCYLVAAASFIGVRETRHFKGLYTITGEDILEGRVFDDWIATRNGFNFDIHNVKGPGLDEHGAQAKYHAKGAYTVPLRACIPVKIKSLALAGRNISGTHLAHSNYRVMTICLNVGYGVGTAAAIALRDGVQIRDVDIVKVQKRLEQDGIVP